METPLFCVVVLFFLFWVLVLKHEVEWLKKQMADLREKLARQTQFLKTGVEVTESRRLSKSEIARLDRQSAPPQFKT